MKTSFLRTFTQRILPMAMAASSIATAPAYAAPANPPAEILLDVVMFSPRIDYTFEYSATIEEGAYLRSKRSIQLLNQDAPYLVHIQLEIPPSLMNNIAEIKEAFMRGANTQAIPVQTMNTIVHQRGGHTFIDFDVIRVAEAFAETKLDTMSLIVRFGNEVSLDTQATLEVEIKRGTH